MTRYQTFRENLPFNPNNSSFKDMCQILHLEQEENATLHCPFLKAKTLVFRAFEKIETLYAPSAHPNKACGPCGVTHGNSLLTSSLDKAKEAP